MLRRSLFIGLTAALVAVLAYLVVEGRKQEKAVPPRPVQLVRESRPSLTRLLLPQDLRIEEAKMELSRSLTGPPQGTPGKVAARHRVTVLNAGQLAYENLKLKLSYLAKDDKVLESRTHLHPGPLPPGQSILLDEIAVEGLPAATAKCRIHILFADLTAKSPPPADAH